MQVVAAARPVHVQGLAAGEKAGVQARRHRARVELDGARTAPHDLRALRIARPFHHEAEILDGLREALLQLATPARPRKRHVGRETRRAHDGAVQAGGEDAAHEVGQGGLPDARRIGSLLQPLLPKLAAAAFAEAPGPLREHVLDLPLFHLG